jgi:hypothetical protein
MGAPTTGTGGFIFDIRIRPEKQADPAATVMAMVFIDRHSSLPPSPGSHSNVRGIILQNGIEGKVLNHSRWSR